MAKGKSTKSMRTLTIIDVDTYSDGEVDFMRDAITDMSDENYLIDMKDFMDLLKTTLATKKLEGFICKLKQMNMV